MNRKEDRYEMVKVRSLFGAAKVRHILDLKFYYDLQNVKSPNPIAERDFIDRLNKQEAR
jgi:hypothetical protein